MKELINIVNSKLQVVIDELKAQKDTLEAKVKTVVDDIDKKVAIASQYKKNVEKSNNIITELEEEINKLKKDLRELHEKFDSAGFTELLEAGNKEINGKIIEHNTKISEEQNNIKNYQEEAANLKDELTSLKDSKTSLETELNNTIVALNFYSAKIDEIAITAIENADKLADYTPEEDNLEDTSTEDIDVNKVIDGTIFEEIDGIATGGKEISEEELNDILSEDKEEEKVEEQPEEETKEENVVEETTEEVVEEEPVEAVKEEVVEETQPEEPVTEENVEETTEEIVEEQPAEEVKEEVVEDNNKEQFLTQITAQDIEEKLLNTEPTQEVESGNADIDKVLKEIGLDPTLVDKSVYKLTNIDQSNATKIMDTLDTHFIDLNNIYSYPSILVTMKPDVLSDLLDILEFAGCIPTTITYLFSYLDKIDLNKLKEKVKGSTDCIINVLFDIMPNLEVQDIGQILGLSADEVATLRTKLDDREYSVMCSFPEIVRTNYNTLKGLHVDDINKCFTEHPKRFMNNPDVFEAILDKYDPQDLVRCINKNAAVIDKL